MEYVASSDRLHGCPNWKRLATNIPLAIFIDVVVHASTYAGVKDSLSCAPEKAKKGVEGQSDDWHAPR